MMSALPVSGPPSKSVKEERVSPNAVAARSSVPSEYLGSVPNQEQQGGPNKKQSESFHTYISMQRLAAESIASALRLSWLPRARG